MIFGKLATQRYSFSGHESFHCRSLWLKKGYDFLNNGYAFNSPDAVVHLGVGKNMVAAIRFWMKAFGRLFPTVLFQGAQWVGKVLVL